MKQFEINGRIFAGYLALPASNQGAGLLLLHSWWGLNDFFKQICERLAQAGFVALALDYYHGATAETIEQAQQLRQGLDRKKVNREVAAGVDYLGLCQAVDRPHLGVIGFSLGCGFALEATRSKPNAVKAVVLYYGTGGGKFDKTEATFLGHFASDDQWGAAPKKVRALEERIRAANKTVKFYTYENTGHWFFEEDRPDSYNVAAAQLAWKRTIQFLQEELG